MFHLNVFVVALFTSDFVSNTFHAWLIYAVSWYLVNFFTLQLKISVIVAHSFFGIVTIELV